MAEPEGFIEHGTELEQGDLDETPLAGEQGLGRIAPATPTRQSLAIGGQNYEVDPALAQALQAERANWDTERQQVHQELQAHREWQGRVTESVNPPQRGEPPGGGRADLWTDPAAYERQLEDRITTNLSARYQQDQNIQAFWRDFDEDFPQLRPYRSMAERVVSQGMAQYRGMSLTDARKKVGEQVTTELMDIAAKFQQPSPAVRTSRLRVVESGGADVPIMPAVPPGSAHADTLGGAIKERRRGRQRSA